MHGIVRILLTILCASTVHAMSYSVELEVVESAHNVECATTTRYKLTDEGEFKLSTTRSCQQNRGSATGVAVRTDTVTSASYRLSPTERANAHNLVSSTAPSGVTFIQAPASDLSQPNANYSRHSTFIYQRGLSKVRVGVGDGVLTPQTAQELHNLLLTLSAKATQ